MQKSSVIVGTGLQTLPQQLRGQSWTDYKGGRPAGNHI